MIVRTEPGDRGSGSDACPCGGPGSYSTCCERFHRGQEPADAAALVRARFAAYARGRTDFLARTLHRDHADRALPARELRARLERAVARTRFRSLEILDADGPDRDGVYRVLFRVLAAHAGRDASFVELSSFAKDGGLRYVAGRIFPASMRQRSIAELDR